MNREEFRKSVFERDHSTCIVCGSPAVDAHHIMERRLWPDGGYHLDNGVAVCAKCHLACERTEFSTDKLREWAKISNKILPPHLYDDQSYDKWGNIVLANGQRLRGELFYDESVQKILQSKLNLFTYWVKYPRTYHLPWSENITKDDRTLENLTRFIDQRVIVTEKMDGENTTLYIDHVHARSLDSQNHPSRNWIKNFWGKLRYDIPKGWRICGENLYATHSISYTNLDTYFQGFSVWNDKNECLSWPETLEWFHLLGIQSVPVLYAGPWSETLIRDSMYKSGSEGYVVRIADKFSYGEFKECVGKFVRANHVKTVKHWMHGQPLIQNLLRKNNNE